MSSPPPPPLSPSVATPLAHRKRRHSEINGSNRPKVTRPLPHGDKDCKPPSDGRLQVPHARGRSTTPVKRERTATPPSAEKPLPKANGAVSPRPHVAGRPSASPRPMITGVRPSASPRPRNMARPAASPSPSFSGRPPASPRSNGAPRAAASSRPSVTSRPSASAQPSMAARPGASSDHRPVQRRLEDSDDEDGSDVDQSDIEDILDSAELEPFTLANGDEDATELDAQTIAHLKQRNLEIGPEAFMEETLNVAKMPPKTLGMAFGLEPSIFDQLEDAIYLRILGQMVVRHYLKRQKLPQYNNLDDVAALLKDCKNIVVVAGAGISTSLGIPDFRSKGSGFYARAIAKAADKGFDISEPEEIFNIEDFDNTPGLFFALAGDILPDEKKFSPTHAFIKLLQDKSKLLTCYTQNIDNLEQSAGIARDKLIQCHGSFATATCRRNGYKNEGHRVPGSAIFDDIRAGRIAYCKRCEDEIAAMKAERKAKEKRQKRFKLTPNKRTPTPFADSDGEGDDENPGIMKPDITFFGEQLPNTFFERFTENDCKVVDLVLVLGTSLKVAPVSEMPNYLPHKVPHVYISREAIRHVEFDVQCLGDCDDVVVELCNRAGWTGGDGKAVVEHEMVHAKDVEGSVIVVEEAEGEEAHKWRVRREQLIG